LSPLHKNSTQNKIEYQFNKYLKKNKINLKNRKIQEVAFVNAAIWLISRRCIEIVGGFDPFFSHYGEDFDYARRVTYWGGKLGIVVTSIGYHERENVESDQYNINKMVIVAQGLLKNINKPLLFVILLLTYKILSKLLKSLINFDFKLVFKYCNTYIKSISQLAIVNKQRKVSKCKCAFLSI